MLNVAGNALVEESLSERAYRARQRNPFLKDRWGSAELHRAYSYADDSDKLLRSVGVVIAGKDDVVLDSGKAYQARMSNKYLGNRWGDEELTRAGVVSADQKNSLNTDDVVVDDGEVLTVSGKAYQARVQNIYLGERWGKEELARAGVFLESVTSSATTAPYSPATEEKIIVESPLDALVELNTLAEGTSSAVGSLPPSELGDEIAVSAAVESDRVEEGPVIPVHYDAWYPVCILLPAL